MFNKAACTITLGNCEQKVEKFTVWFMTPFGLMDDLNYAVLRCVAADLDPELSIKPVSIAITETTYEVIG